MSLSVLKAIHHFKISRAARVTRLKSLLSTKGPSRLRVAATAVRHTHCLHGYVQSSDIVSPGCRSYGTLSFQDSIPVSWPVPQEPQQFRATRGPTELHTLGSSSLHQKYPCLLGVPANLPYSRVAPHSGTVGRRMFLITCGVYLFL